MSRKRLHEKSNSVGRGSVTPVDGTTGFIRKPCRFIGPSSVTSLALPLVALPSGFNCGNAPKEGSSQKT